MTLLEATPLELRAELERRRNQQTIQGEADQLQRDFPLFVRRAWPVLEPETVFVPNWHIDAICEHLAAVDRSEIRRLVINVPPRHMKSLTVSVFWPVWRWTTQPATRFLTASYGIRLAERDATKSRNLIRSNWFRSHWPWLELKGDVNRVGRYENTRTGYRIATSVGGDATGEGGDVIILDDPHKSEEALSDTYRAKVIDWHAGTISSRFNDPKTGVEILIMQRLHERDLTGHVLERGGWTHLCLPARYEPKHPFLWPDDPRTQDGELLWPERMPEAELEELSSSMTTFRAAGQLQQRPAPREGEILKRAWWRCYDPRLLEPHDGRMPVGLPVFQKIVCSWDTAFKAKTNSDYVAGQVWGIKGADRYLLRVVRERLSLAETEARMLELREWARKWWPSAAHHVLIEKSANGVEILETLRRKVPGVLPIVASVDKVLRAEAAAADLESGNVFVPAIASEVPGEGPAAGPLWALELVEECATFPNGQNDDQVDAFTQAINWARQRPQVAVRMSVADGII